MQIQSLTDNAASSAAQTDSTQTAAANALASSNSLANENTFLQLLVAQIKNQDPTQPIDGTTFLTQLAQFSQLEQLIGIRQDVGQLDPAATAPSGTTAPTNPAGGN